MANSRAQGAVAQLGERLVCNQEATGSIPVSSTKFLSSAGSLATAAEIQVADLVGFLKGLAEFVVIVGLIGLRVWSRTRTIQNIEGESGTKIQTLFGKDRWWQP
jgi:hypothetical protein